MTNERDEVESLRSQVQNLSDQLLPVKSTLSKKENHIGHLKGDIDSKSYEVENLRRRENVMEESVNEMRQDNMTQATRIRELPRELQQNKDIVVNLPPSLNLVKENISKDCGISREEIFTLIALCDDKDREITAKKYEVQQLKSLAQTLQSYELELSKHDALDKALQHQLAYRTGDLGRLKEDLHRTVERREKESKTHAAETRQLELKLQKRVNNVVEHQRQDQELSWLKDLCKNKDSEIRLKLQEAARLKAVLKNLSEELDQMKVLVSQKDQDLEKLQRHVQKLNNEVAGKNGKIQLLKSENKKCYASNDRLHQEGYAKSEQIFEFTEQLAKVNQVKEELEKQ